MQRDKFSKADAKYLKVTLFTFFHLLFLCAGVCILAILLHHFHIGCIIRTLSGIPCPGCGMTRAWLAVLQGDLCQAFTYHPLFFTIPYLLLCCVLYHYKWKWVDISLYALAILFLLCYMIRLCMGI